MREVNKRKVLCYIDYSYRSFLTDFQDISYELISGHLEVHGGGALTDATRGVVMGSVTGAVVPTKVPGLSDGYATQMGADTDNDQEVGVLYPIQIVLGVTKFGHVH